MTYYLLISTDGNCWTQDKQPVSLDNIATMLPFSTYDDATMAKDMYYAHKPVPRTVANLERVAVLEAEIDEYKAINKRLVERIDGLLAHQSMLKNYAYGIAEMCNHVLSKLSVQTILQATHRERNEQLRDIVRNMSYLLNQPIDYWRDNPSQDTTEIPF